MEIIVKKKPSKYVLSPKVYTPSNVARLRVTKEHRQDYDNEKRARELAARMPDGKREHIAVAVAKMMNIPEAHARKWIMDKNSKVVLDGKIN